MRYALILLSVLFVAGCATRETVAIKSPPLRPFVLAVAPPSKRVETRYEVRSYREAANPSIRHDAHAVYRNTRVPITVNEELETVPRTNYPPASISPLPASQELAAELGTQKSITTELHSMQATMAEAAQRMQAQYAQLVRQSAEVLKVREQLESARSLKSDTGSSETASFPPTAATTGATNPKW